MPSRFVGSLVFFGVIAVASPSWAQLGGWVSANVVAVIPAEKTLTLDRSFPVSPFFDPYKDSVVYTAKTKPSFDVGGGILLFRGFGVGVAVSRYEDKQPASISLAIPDTRVANRIATTSAVTPEQMSYQETAVHIEARYVANLPHASIAVFVGPSSFKTTRDLVADYTYLNTLLSTLSNPSHTIQFLDDTRQSVDFSAWGYNVGVDVGYFFTEKAGVGVLARFSRAKNNVPNLLTTPNPPTQSIDIGGFNIGGGLRLRF